MLTTQNKVIILECTVANLITNLDV